MNHKERVIRAVDHEEPDRVPLDEEFCPANWQNLFAHFSTRDKDAVRERLGVDLRTITMGPNNPDTWYLHNHPMQTLNAAPPGTILEDEWGIKSQVNATGKATRFVYHPLEHIEPGQYDFPDLDAPGRFDDPRRLMKIWGGKYAVSAHMEYTFFEMAWYLRGFARFLRDLRTDPKFVRELLDRLLDYRIEEAKRFMELGVDIIRLGDDLGTQNTLIMSPETWRRYFKPRLRDLIRRIKRGGEMRVFYHSDGHIEPFISDFIEIGVDILDPVQPECNDVVAIKRRYGDRLTLHGTISVQKTMPFGSVRDVEREVLDRLENVAPGGGLILGSSHIIHDASLDNILAIYDTVLKHGNYPINIP